MRSGGHDAPFVEHHNPVGAFNRGQTVRHHQQGAPLGQTLNSQLHRAFRFRVQRRGGFIQQQHFGIAQNGPRNRNALLLAPRQHDAAFPQIAGIALRQGGDKIMRCGRARGVFNLGWRRIGPAKADILHGRGRKDHRVLRHHCHGTAKIGARHVAQINAVQQDSTLLWIIKPHQQLQYRRFTRPRRPNQRHRLACRHGQRNAVQGRGFGPRRIAKADIAQGDLAAHRAGQQARIGGFLHLIRRMQHLDQTFGGPRRPLQLAPDFRQRSHRARHQHRINHELHQFAGAHRARLHIACAHPQHANDAGEHKKNHDDRHHRPGADPGFGRPKGPFGDIAKFGAGLGLMRERLHRLHRCQCLGRHARRLRDQILIFAA